MALHPFIADGHFDNLLPELKDLIYKSTPEDIQRILAASCKSLRSLLPKPKSTLPVIAKHLVDLCRVIMKKNGYVDLQDIKHTVEPSESYIEHLLLKDCKDICIKVSHTVNSADEWDIWTQLDEYDLAFSGLNS